MGFFVEQSEAPTCYQCDYGTTNNAAGSADEDECRPCPDGLCDSFRF